MVLELFKGTIRFLAQGAGSIHYLPEAAARARKTTLRAQGVLGFVALVVYVAVAGLLIATQREAFLQIVQELERVYLKEDALTKSSTSLAHAVLEVNEAYFESQTTPRFDNIAVNIEAVQAGLQPLLADYPSLTLFKTRIDRDVSGLRAMQSRTILLDLRDSLHALVGELDTFTRGVREHRKNLSDRYRTVYDSMTVIAVTMGLAGFVLFGGLTALFFSRLAWDLNRLEQRAREVVRGYRGEPLRVTRTDEVGGLMSAVNQMQADLRSRERQLELVRQQRFHQEKMAAVGSLAASIAHEINNPIAAITGVAQEMCAAQQQCVCRAHDARALPELILEQAQRIARITRQVSDLAAPQSSQMQWMDVNGLLRRTCNFVSYDQRLRGVDVDLDLDSQLPAFYGVPDEVSQIIMNLLLNAADAVSSVVGRRARVELSSRFDADTLVLTVSDNGEGMTEATRARAFEEGFTTKSKGSGMGLFICKSLIEARGGTIELASTHGAGSTVRVRLSQQCEWVTERKTGTTP
jgi:two-component system NtrC family sensor kinase